LFAKIFALEQAQKGFGCGLEALGYRLSGAQLASGHQRAQLLQGFGPNLHVFTHDEALILKENVSPLKNLDDEQFRKAWDYVINDVGAQISLDATTVKIMKDLKNIVAISDRTRQVVEAYKTRTGETRMERDISLRGSIEAARFYSENHLWEADLSKMPNWKAGWNPAQYAIAMTYLPHTDTYRRGKTDKDAMMLILAEGIR